MDADDGPYEPRRPGFDKEATRRAQATAERAQAVRSGAGELADAAYVEDGPDEAARRMGESREEVGDAVERAARRKR